ncbi:hypothetical protein ATCC90586_005128 [Pythium insidiosum]|nr:hypothetical protein ATCC90586_005128 [Pythium insidiosum]
MFCGECGHRWAPEEIASARFCAECGAPREDPVPAPVAAPAPPAPSAPERVENYNITKVNETITVVHNARVEEFAEERYYNERTLPDNNEWQDILRQHRQRGTQFTDPQFPPDSTSLFRDVNNKRSPQLEDAVWKWKRISEFFNETAYVEVTMLDDAKKLVCSIAMKSPAEAESILSILRQDPPARPIEPEFFRIAQEAVSTGMSKRRRDHLLLCTKNMITYLSDYVQDGIQRFDLLPHGKPVFGSFTGSQGKFEIWSLLIEKAAFMAFFPTILEARNLYNYGALPDETGSQVPVSSESVHIITSEWSGLTCGGREAMHLNPQYHLVPQSLASSGQLTAQLEQPSRRMKNELEYATYIAPAVFRHVGEPGERKIDLASHDVIATGTFISTRNTVLETKLEPGADIAATPLPGKFSGRIFSLPDGVTVHAECIDAYRIRIADKCIECGAAIAAVPGRFDGTYFDIPSAGGKCHAECMEAYQLRTAKRCRHCSEAVAKVPGRFDGRFYKLPESEDVVHFECWDAYQAAMAPKCVHCSQPVMVVPGRFDGRFYDLTSGAGKVHFECWDAYQAAVMRR